MSLTIVWFTLGLWTVDGLVSDLVQYPRINSSVTLNCECKDTKCQKVFWYRIRKSDHVYEHLLMCNAADQQYPSKDSSLFGRMQGRKGGPRSYSLTASNLTLEDAGWYACFFSSQIEFKSYFLRVGEAPPTQEPPRPKTTTKKTIKSKPKPPPCCFSYRPPEGCGKWILWPLSGTLVCLSIALAAILYYFSRLPKKCRHHFAKKKQLT